MPRMAVRISTAAGATRSWPRIPRRENGEDMVPRLIGAALRKLTAALEAAALARLDRRAIVRIVVARCPDRVREPQQAKRDYGDGDADDLTGLEGAERDEEREHHDHGEAEQPERLAQRVQDLRPAPGHVRIVSTPDEAEKDQQRDERAHNRHRALEQRLAARLAEVEHLRRLAFLRAAVGGSALLGRGRLSGGRLGLGLDLRAGLWGGAVDARGSGT